MKRTPLIGSLLVLSATASCNAPALDEQPAAEAQALTAAPDEDANGTAETYAHVLLLSIDGLHQIDLARFVADHPSSALAQLSRHGITYEQAFVNRLDGTPTNPSDSFPGLLALTTGGSSPTTGGWYDVSHVRDLYPYAADAPCTGKRETDVAYDESLEKDNSNLWGVAGGTPTHEVKVVRARIDLTKLPYRKRGGTCEAVFPHDFIRVNTIFEVASEAGLHTAWSDKHPAYELVSGPSGGGVDDFFAPEINSLATNLIPSATAGADFTASFAYAETYDDLKVRAILNQIGGHWSDHGLAGATDTAGRPGVPAIFGMNFQAVSVAEKNALGQGGYLDAAGTPGPELADALAHTDAAIGRMTAALEAHGLARNTLVIVTAKHGQSPIDKNLVNKVDGDGVATLVDTAAGLAGHIEDDVALYWLNERSGAEAARAALTDPAASPQPSVERVFTLATPGFATMFGDPRRDPRTPDVVVQPKKGTIYSLSKKKFAEHGGFADDDAHVGLLVSSPRLHQETNAEPVRTKQVAPTILRALGLPPARLEAVRKEGTRVLPGLSRPERD